MILNSILKLTLTFFLLFLFSNSEGQSLQDLKQQADKAFKDGDYPLAIEFQKKILLKSKVKLGKKHKGYYKALYKLADYNYWNFELELAKFQGLEALELAGELYGKSHKEYANPLGLLAISLTEMGEFDQAKIYFEEAFQVLKKSSDINNVQYVDLANNYGIYNCWIGKYDIAEKIYEESIRISEHFKGDSIVSYSVSLNNLAALYSDLDVGQKALPLIQKAVKIDKEMLGENHSDFAITLSTMGRIYQDLGMYTKAETAFKKALKIRKSVFDTSNEIYSISLFDLGLLYFAYERFDKAEYYFNKVIEIEKKNNRSNTPYYYVCLASISEFYLKTENYAKAKEINEDILNFRKKKNGLNNINYVSALIRESNILIHQERHQEAESVALKALEFVENAQVQDQVMSVKLLVNLTNLYYLKSTETPSQKKQALETAMKFCQKSIDENIDKDLSKFNNDNVISQFIDLNQAIKSYKLKAKIYNQMAIENDNSLDLYMSALDALEIGGKLIEIKKNDNLTQYDRLLFNKSVSEIFSFGLDISYQLYQLTNDQKFFNRAFQYSEKNKSSVLNRAVHSNYALQYAGIPSELLDREKTLKAYLNFYKSKMLKERMKSDVLDNDYLLELENKYFKFNSEYDSLIAHFENNYPNYYNMKYRLNLFQPDAYDELLDNTDVIIYQFTAQSSVYIFHFSEFDKSIQKIKTNGQLSVKISDMNQSLLNADYETYVKNAKSLYNTLLRPIEEDILTENLVIIPDGPLWNLNFDILIKNDTGPKNSFKYTNYLINEYAISYNFSVDLWAFEKKKTSISEHRGCLAFSYSKDANEDRGNSLSLRSFRDNKVDLPGTRKEIKAISELIDGNYFYGDFANEKNFKLESEKYSILHLALHGEVNNQEPMKSRLVFTQTKEGNEDDYLHAYELYNMELDAELAVLSACETGAGKVEQGEGIMSLGRAFMYSGVKSVVVSQWKLPDNTTPVILKTFYTNLNKGIAKDEALRLAKIEYLKNSDNNAANPFLWSGLVLIGDNSSLNLSPNSYLTWILASAGAVMIALYISRKDVRNKLQSLSFS